MEYLRIGTDYYKKVQIPLHSGDILNTLLKWRKGEIITDQGKDYLNQIEKFDGFCLIPSHTNYEFKIKNFYNKYEKVEHVFTPGEYKITEQFLKHYFGEQYELGLDYLSILWHHPTQILPVLCFVSQSRNTGKTTFLNWLKLIYQGNLTINKNEDFKSRFNSDWSSKLIIAVDEVLLDKKEDSERIKNLSTARSYKTESKGIDKTEDFFFGKFILCSNNEENFVLVDKEEIRYWVLKIPTLKNKEKPDLLDDLKKELPHFMYFLNTRKIKSEKKTRMWFTKEQIYTDALKKLVKGNKTYLEKEIKEIITDDFLKFEVEELKYSLSDLVERLSKNNIRVSSSKVSEILKDKFEIEPKNSSYIKYHISINPAGGNFNEETKSKGRHFTFFYKDFIQEETCCNVENTY